MHRFEVAPGVTEGCISGIQGFRVALRQGKPQPLHNNEVKAWKPFKAPTLSSIWGLGFRYGFTQALY